MPTFEQIKRFYSLGLWTKAMVQKSLAKGLLTQEQYDEITGNSDGSQAAKNGAGGQGGTGR